VTTPAGSIAVVGSLNRDYVCRVSRLPAPGETRLGSELTWWCGGKGGNQAVAAALAGAGRDVAVAMVGAVGADPDGEALRQGLADAGVDVTDVVTRVDVRTGAALITVADDGENAIVVAPGANATVSVGEVAAALRRRRPAVVVTQGELPAEVVAAALAEAVRIGARPVLNLAPVMTLDDDVLAVCDPLVVNRGEAASVLDAPGDAAPEQLARDLAGRARSVVVTAGAGGAWVAEGGSVSHVPAVAADVVDTTGAGDAFTGAMAVGLALGRDLVAAAGWGAAVAAYSVGRPGTQASYPRADDLDLR
jgi:ribokinase